MICKNCNYENVDNASICTRCGELLVQASSTTVISDVSHPDADPKYGSIHVSETLILQILDTDTLFEFNTDGIQQLVIGRRDPDTGKAPDVDLHAHDAIELGVSRNHAIIEYRDRAFHIRDNHSANGTYLNGQRLFPDKLRVMRDGDDIRIGKLVLRVIFA
ncbi:MAG: FHA domain-containing protein [Anaerolineae bacterium]